jgi:hypothetical protein
MRFLQSEWHRHERDRNGWEIERQEMKGRIARLEGSTRKSDSSNKSLKKYVNMLEKALKERDAQVKALKAGLQPGSPVEDKEPGPKRKLRTEIVHACFANRRDSSSGEITKIVPRGRRGPGSGKGRRGSGSRQFEGLHGQDTGRTHISHGVAIEPITPKRAIGIRRNVATPRF